MGVAGCLARSDCKERDKLAINQGLQHELRSGEVLIPMTLLQDNNKESCFTL